MQEEKKGNNEKGWNRVVFPNMSIVDKAIKSIKPNMDFVESLGKQAEKIQGLIPNIKPTLMSIKPPKIKPLNYYDRYNEYGDDISKNEDLIKEKKAKIDEIDRGLSKIGVSKNIIYGLIALIFFSIVGIIFPLVLIPIDEATHLRLKWVVIGSFILGLASVFGYVFYEIYYIRKKEIQPESKSNKTTMDN